MKRNVKKHAVIQPQDKSIRLIPRYWCRLASTALILAATLLVSGCGTSNRIPIATIAVHAINNQKKQLLTLSNSPLSDDDDDAERILDAVEIAMTFSAFIITLWIVGAIIRIYKDRKQAK